MPKPTTFNLRLAVILICALAGGAAQADVTRDSDDDAMPGVVFTGAGQKIPAGAFGILLIERPREMTLLYLRGIGGRGEVILRTDEPGTCLTVPIRLVAGDFNGKSISGHLADPIRLVIKSEQVARALAKGHDVVSDTYRVSDQMGPDADIVLQSGLHQSVGFVINPGRNIFADIFGVATQRISCRFI